MIVAWLDVEFLLLLVDAVVIGTPFGWADVGWRTRTVFVAVRTDTLRKG